MYTGKLALITGASAGLGEEFARQLHSKGADVILVARRRDRLTALCGELNAIRPGSARSVVADLSARGVSQADVKTLDSVVAVIKENKIDILVNNAGRGSFGCFDSISIEDEVQMVALNCIAQMVLCSAAIPQMKDRKEGAIINLGSVVSFQPLPFMATYSATKAFDFAHSMSLRYELAKYGVRVLTVCPGPTATEFGGVARVPGTFTGGTRDSAQAVVSESIIALEKNSPYVVPGIKAKLMAFFSRVLPRELCSWLGYRILIPLIRR